MKTNKTKRLPFLAVARAVAARRTALLLPAFALFCACSSIDCPVQNVVRSYYQVLDGDGNKVAFADVLTITSKRLGGSDTVLFNQGTNVSAFSLPMGYTTPEDTLYFSLSNDSAEWLDTVWIKKDNISHFESVDCSASFFHKLTAVRSTGHIFDSIVINYPSVNYDTTKVHFNLYVKTSD